MNTLGLIIIVLLLFGTSLTPLCTSRCSYYPAGGLGTVLLILLLLALTGRL